MFIWGSLMGHTRLGPIPKTRKWNSVVAAINGIGNNTTQPLLVDVNTISYETLKAAESGLTKSINDIGLRYTFYLLIKLVQASREDDWTEALQAIGISLPEQPTVFDLTVALHAAIDDYLGNDQNHTDVSEMAQISAGEAISTLLILH